MDEATPTYADRLAAIQQHLATGGKVMLVTYTTGTIYDRRHHDWFTATSTGLYVRRGAGTVCLNLSPIKFSRTGVQ